ncbi:MAG TPA: M56 family metallopeptidase [Gammaproteobacteria bacterium]|nr:M56 family metallopeptidase [Gammaproteobacteria bacterium]
MSNSVLSVLAQTTLAATVAIILVALVRKPLARIAGARVAYLVWLLVPACTVAVLLPAPVQPLALVSEIVPLVSTVLPAAAPSTAASAQGAGVPIALVIWMAGAVLLLALMLYRQRAFIRSLGKLTLAADGTHRSHTIRGPVLVGLWKPRIVLPTNFEKLYGPDERALVIAHERAHQRRLDIPLNAIAAAWLCCSWFNPLMYWALGRFRADQELACDAVVLAETSTTRRRYSEALFKAQLVEDSMLPVPAICNWGSKHPLKERIVMMNRPLPSRLRRIAGSTVTAALIAAGGFAVWSTQPKISHAQSPVAAGQSFCAPFVPYARNLLAFVERDAQSASARDEIRRVAQATVDCAASGARLWSRADADARLVEVQKQFEHGTNTSVAVNAAQVGVAKADFCVAEFSHLSSTAQQQQRRSEVGLIRTDELAPVLAELVSLLPVCGWSP